MQPIDKIDARFDKNVPFLVRGVGWCIAMMHKYTALIVINLCLFVVMRCSTVKWIRARTHPFTRWDALFFKLEQIEEDCTRNCWDRISCRCCLMLKQFVDGSSIINYRSAQWRQAAENKKNQEATFPCRALDDNLTIFQYCCGYKKPPVGIVIVVIPKQFRVRKRRIRLITLATSCRHKERKHFKHFLKYKK